MFHPSSHSVTMWGGQTSGSNQPNKNDATHDIYIYRYIDIVDLIPGCLVAELSPKRGTPGTLAQAWTKGLFPINKAITYGEVA